MIPDLQVEDSGEYVCKARNVYGQVEQSFPVKVYGKLSFSLEERISSQIACVALEARAFHYSRFRVKKIGDLVHFLLL